MTLFAFAFLLSVPVACQSAHEATRRDASLVLQKVERGMSPVEVRTVMGAPVRTIREDGDVQWMVYGMSARRLMIYFQDERVVAVPRRPGPRAYTDGQ